MTDQRLRDLERDAAHGDLQARARLLLERVRVGELTEDKLQLAAHLGDEAACAALGTGGQLLVMNADWFRGLTPWSPALAVWALAEACASRHEPEDELLLGEVRLGLRTAFISGKAADFARSMPAAELSPLCFGSASGKSLVLWLERLKQDGRRSRLDHPEILRALDEVRSRFSPQEVGELSYAWSEREYDGTWVHRVRHLRPTGVEKLTTAIASTGWQPDPDAGAPDPTFLYDLEFAFPDPERARAAVRAALLPWALAPRGSST